MAAANKDWITSSPAVMEGIDIIVGTITVIHMEYSAMAAGDMDSLDTIINCHT